MAKVKYYYDTRTLSYKRIELNAIQKAKKGFYYILSSFILAIVIIGFYNYFFDSPKEIRLKKEVQFLSSNYKDLQTKMSHLELVIDDMQRRDDNIYRVIFEADPIPNSIRKAGFGGVNRYEKYRGYNTSELVTITAKKIDQITKQLYIQSKSFDHIIELAKNKSEMLAAIPAIQPIDNKDLTRIASGFGPRIHPIYKIRKMHYGVDFTAKTGTPIYATGDGRISRADNRAVGFGNHVRIDHGFGYTSIYAHMSKIEVRRGNRVKRGDLIGYVGNTGRSVAPHLHYEILKDGKKINPINFYSGSLSPSEFEQLVNLASQENQSLD